MIIRRWQDPAFPRTFSWLQADDFWQKQSLEFNQQIERLQDAPLQLTPSVLTFKFLFLENVVYEKNYVGFAWYCHVF